MRNQVPEAGKQFEDESLMGQIDEFEVLAKLWGERPPQILICAVKQKGVTRK